MIKKGKIMFFYNDAVQQIIDIAKFSQGNIKRNGSVAFSFRRLKEFQLVVEARIPRQKNDFKFGKAYKNIAIAIRKRQYLMTFYFGSTNLNTLKADVSTFRTKGYSVKAFKYHRLLIPVSQEINFFYNLETIAFASDYLGRILNGTEVKIGDDLIFVNYVNREIRSKKYSFIAFESTQKQSLEAFRKKAYAASIAFGYITGYFAADSGYYFQYSNKKMVKLTGFHFTEMRSSVISQYTPVNSNYGAFAHAITKAQMKRYKENKLTKVSIAVCSLLAERIYNDNSFAFAVMLLLESSSASLLVKPSGFAICLEILHDVIMNGKAGPLSLIADKVLGNKIKAALIQVIDNHKDAMNDKVYATIKSRTIDFNRATSLNKLRAPFDALGLKITAEDLTVLKTRNNFLHGTVPNIFKRSMPRSQSDIDYETYYISLRFYTLLNMLILKWVGFEGYVINHPFIQRKLFKIKLKEEPYRSTKDYS